MKILLYLMLFLFLISCQKNLKSEKNVDRKTIKFNSTNKLKFEFSNDTLLRIINSTEGYEIVFYDGNINKIAGVLNQKKRGNLEIIDFDGNGNFEKYFWRDDKLNEHFYLNNYKDFLEYGIFKKFSSDNFLVPITNLSISKNNRDTFNYFYYKQTKEGFQIFTDSKNYHYNPTTMDSVIIKYVEHKLKEKYFFSPETNLVIPDVEKFKNKKVTNGLFLPTKSKIAIGTLWTFFNPKKVSHDLYSYQMLYFDGDIMSRMKQYGNFCKTFQSKYSSRMIDNKNIVAEIIESGYYKLIGDKLVRDKTGE